MVARTLSTLALGRANQLLSARWTSSRRFRHSRKVSPIRQFELDIRSSLALWFMASRDLGFAGSSVASRWWTPLRGSGWVTAKTAARNWWSSPYLCPMLVCRASAELRVRSVKPSAWPRSYQVGVVEVRPNLHAPFTLRASWVDSMPISHRDVTCRRSKPLTLLSVEFRFSNWPFYFIFCVVSGCVFLIEKLVVSRNSQKQSPQRFELVREAK